MSRDQFRLSGPNWPALGPIEQQFLLECLRVDSIVSCAPPAGFEWPLFAGRVVSDGLAPLLYNRFKSCPQVMPSQCLEQFKRYYYQNFSVNLLRLEELERIGKSLAGIGVPLLVLKGGALAPTVYSDPALRFMGDLDLAVPPDQTKMALAHLQADGYELQTDDGQPDVSEPGAGRAGLLRERGWHIRLARTVRGKKIDLELHWPLRQRVLVSQTANLELNQVWAGAVPLNEAANLWQPAPAFMLLHLCLHTALQHRFTDLGLRHYVDIDRAVRAYMELPGFWQDFLSEARVARASAASYFCLRLARGLLGTPLSDAVLQRLQPPQWKHRLFERRFVPADAINRSRTFYDHNLLWRLLIVERPSDLFVGFWQLLFPGRAYLASYYSSQDGLRLAAYSLWHPFHALSRAIRRRVRERLLANRQA